MKSRSKQKRAFIEVNSWFSPKRSERRSWLHIHKQNLRSELHRAQQFLRTAEREIPSFFPELDRVYQQLHCCCEMVFALESPSPFDEVKDLVKGAHNAIKEFNSSTKVQYAVKLICEQREASRDSSVQDPDSHTQIREIVDVFNRTFNG